MKSLKHLNKYIFKYKFRLLLGFLFITASNIFGLFPPRLIREAFDLADAQLRGTTLEGDSFLTTYFVDASFTKIVLSFGLYIGLVW